MSQNTYLSRIHWGRTCLYLNRLLDLFANEGNRNGTQPKKNAVLSLWKKGKGRIRRYKQVLVKTSGILHVDNPRGYN